MASGPSLFGQLGRMARTTGAVGGIGTFPLQLPGYAYCATEVQAPPNYVADPTQQCTDVLGGTTAVPAPITTLTFDDTEQTVNLSVFKYNSLTPGTGIPGAAGAGCSGAAIRSSRPTPI